MFSEAESSTGSDVRPDVLRVQHHEAGENVCVVEISGEIDLGCAAELKGALVELVEAGHTRLVLDLAGVAHMDSTGLGVLIGVRKRLAEDGVLTLARAPKNVVTVMSLTGLDRSFAMFSSLAEAVDHAQRPLTPALSEDAAMVVGLASTALPFAESPEAEVERWLRVLRLHGEAGHVLTALGVSEAPLTSIGHAEQHAPIEADAAHAVTDHAARHARLRASATVGTADLLAGVMEVYGEDFDRVITAYGSDRAELAERLALPVES